MMSVLIYTHNYVASFETCFIGETTCNKYINQQIRLIYVRRVISLNYINSPVQFLEYLYIVALKKGHNRSYCSL